MRKKLWFTPEKVVVFWGRFVDSRILTSASQERPRMARAMRRMIQTRMRMIMIMIIMAQARRAKPVGVGDQRGEA